MSARTTARSGRSSSNSPETFTKRSRMLGIDSISSFPRSATTTCGRPGWAIDRAASMALWSRPSTVMDDQPSILKRSPMPPGQPWVAEWLSMTQTVSLDRLNLPATAIASWLLPSSSSASPTRQNTLGSTSPFRSNAVATPTAMGQTVSQRSTGDLHAGYERAVGMLA